MNQNKLRLATVFSGIGAVEQALNKMHVLYEIVFACDNGERKINKTYDEIIENYKEDGAIIDINDYVKNIYYSTNKTNFMKKSYFANYDINESKWFEDIRFIEGKKFQDKVDLFVGGSPCQSFSIIGKRAGLEDTRGTLFYDYARLIKEMQPKVFIYENVLGMMTHDKGATWKVILDIFISLGYDVHIKILNSKDYGIPQDRKRIFVVGFKKEKKDFVFPEKISLNTTMFDFLEKDVQARHYLGKKGFEFTTNLKYKSRARINRNIIQTQKANQQFNWNGDFVFEAFDKVKNNKEILDRAYCGVRNNQKGVIRQLSHRECLRLMGFSDDYKIVVPNCWCYRQSGNSIVVNVLEKILEQIFKVETFI